LKGVSTLAATAKGTKELQAFAPRARLGLGLALASAKSWPQAEAAYRAGIADARGLTFAELNFRLGEALVQQNKSTEAADAFLTVSTLYKDSDWAGEAQWNAGQAFEKLGDKAQAMEVYKSLAARRPESDLTKKAQDRATALGAN